MTQLCVLVVEDNPDCAYSIAALLRMRGHQVQIASDGPSALTAAEANPPDGLLLDIAMPGMDGWQVAKKLRAMRLNKRPVIVAVTVHGRDEDRQHSAEAGIDFHLVKPTDPVRLVDLLEAVAPGN